jgi:peptidoglycan/xylan/chitin deacetylase (PgdA/CDA1 family)/glycosyltransferase involved in cell wall biosynthesis
MRIAVVITNRDLGAMLLEAVDSIERQTRPANEIVIVDDRSTDEETRWILAGLRDRGLTVVEGPGRGASAARNLGASITTADYLVWLDGDDTLAPGYFEAAAARLDADPSLDFVTTAMRAFGESSFVWAPSMPTFVEAVSTGGVPHASTLMRRRVWQDVGGFDEEVPSFELLDFWASALERGFRGIVLPEPFINYRIRRDSGYRRSIQQEIYLSRMRHFYAKHRDAVNANAIELLKGKEAFFISQRKYWRGLEERAAALESELDALKREVARAKCDRRGVVLCYHRVASLSPDAHALCTPPDVFRAHMRTLREQFTPVALDDLVRAAEDGTIPDNAVAITFDDGYLDALTTASPILMEFGIPATFFVNSDRLDVPHERWWDVVERHVADPEVAADLHGRAWPMDERGRGQLLTFPEGSPRDSHRVMTTGELRALASRPGHTIGGHTTHHLALTHHRRHVKRREIADDKAALERAIGRPIGLFSYPYGDFDAETVAVVRKAGYRAAVTVESAAVLAGGDRLLLPRYEVPTRERVDLAARLREVLSIDRSASLQASGTHG